MPLRYSDQGSIRDAYRASAEPTSGRITALRFFCDRPCRRSATSSAFCRSVESPFFEGHRCWRRWRSRQRPELALGRGNPALSPTRLTHAAATATNAPANQVALRINHDHHLLLIPSSSATAARIAELPSYTLASDGQRRNVPRHVSRVFANASKTKLRRRQGGSTCCRRDDKTRETRQRKQPLGLPA